MTTNMIVLIVYLTGCFLSVCYGWYLIAKHDAKVGTCRPDGSEVMIFPAAALWPLWALMWVTMIAAGGVPYLLVKSGIVKAEKNGGAK